jgi:hypothetical protein
MSEPSTSSGTDRRARLLAVKLRALVRDHTGASDESLLTDAFALGTALRHGDAAWVLLEPSTDDGRGLGAALIWAGRSGATSLDVVADAGTGVLARRAAEFALPTRVWRVDNRRLDAVGPAPFASPVRARDEHLAFVTDIENAGAVPVIEHGVVTGEVRGLEVCRVVDVVGPDGPVVRLEVGAGVHDREAFAIMHGDVPTHDALSGVVGAVAGVRDESSPAHPLNRLAPERFLRWRLEQEPWLVDLASVEPAPPPTARRNLKDRTPCSALGRRLDGTPVVVVCSVGVDLDLIPYAADARLAAAAWGKMRGGEPGAWPTVPNGGDLDVVVALPPRDIVPATTELAGWLRHSVTLVSVASASTISA